MRSSGQAGSAATEVVLVFPTLLVLVMVIVQFGLWYHATGIARAAAEEGARAARTDTGTAAAGHDRAQVFVDQLAGTLLTDRTVTATRTADTARVEVHGAVVSLVPFVHLTVTAAAQSPTERFRARNEP